MLKSYPVLSCIQHVIIFELCISKNSLMVKDYSTRERERERERWTAREKYNDKKREIQ